MAHVLQTFTELDEDAIFDERATESSPSSIAFLEIRSYVPMSSTVSTVHYQHTHGKMRWAPTTEYSRGSRGNKVTSLLFNLSQHPA